jgi:site-specific DNA-cytosine methylase
MKLPESRNLLRNKRSSCQTPVSETKKNLSLMPEKIKSNKITFSDLETPQERTKVGAFADKDKKLQGFSDLFPIAEEASKNTPSAKPSPAPTSERKDSMISAKVSKAVKQKKPALYKASSQILDSENTGTLNFNRKDSGKPDMDSARKADLKPHQIETNYLDGEMVTLTIETRLPPKTANTSKEARVGMQNRQSHARGGQKGQNKSMRRNRKERLASAHSQKRLETSQQPKVKPKHFGMKQATSRVKPKICGNNESFTTKNGVKGSEKIKDMLNQIDNLDTGITSTNP